MDSNHAGFGPYSPLRYKAARLHRPRRVPPPAGPLPSHCSAQDGIGWRRSGPEVPSVGTSRPNKPQQTYGCHLPNVCCMRHTPFQPILCGFADFRGSPLPARCRPIITSRHPAAGRRTNERTNRFLATLQTFAACCIDSELLLNPGSYGHSSRRAFRPSLV